MKSRIVVIVLVLCSAAVARGEVETIRFKATDGVQLNGYLYREGVGQGAPLVLLFHQAGGDGRGEYSAIAQRLNDAGYAALAIDQRVGGDRFGSVNQTVGLLGESTYGYCDAYPDLVATLDYAIEEDLGGPIAIWGSSYSAALVLQLAANRPDDVAGVLAFSPASGEPLARCLPGAFIDKLRIPTLALRPITEMQRESTAAQLMRFEELGHKTYVADPGTHGSSMLIAERAGGSTDQTWDVVLGFLAEALAK